MGFECFPEWFWGLLKGILKGIHTWFRVQGLGLRVWSSWFKGLGFTVWGLGLRGLGFQGLGLGDPERLYIGLHIP